MQLGQTGLIVRPNVKVTNTHIEHEQSEETAIYLEFDCFEEYKEGGASVVLHVVVQAESLRKKKMRQECTMQSHFKGFERVKLNLEIVFLKSNKSLCRFKMAFLQAG